MCVVCVCQRSVVFASSSAVLSSLLPRSLSAAAASSPLESEAEAEAEAGWQLMERLVRLLDHTHAAAALSARDLLSCVLAQHVRQVRGLSESVGLSVEPISLGEVNVCVCVCVCVHRRQWTGSCARHCKA